MLVSRKNKEIPCAWGHHQVMLCLKDFRKVFLSRRTICTRRNTWLSYSSDKRRCTSTCSNYKLQGSPLGCHLALCQILCNSRLASYRNVTVHVPKIMPGWIRDIHHGLLEKVRVQACMLPNRTVQLNLVHDQHMATTSRVKCLNKLKALIDPSVDRDSMCKASAQMAIASRSTSKH